MLPSRSKVQHLLGVNNSLGPHPLMKNQRFTLIRVGKLLRVQYTDPKGLVKVRASWPEQPRLYIYIYGSTYGNWSFGEVRRTYRWHCGSILEESGIAFHGLFVMMLVMEIESGFGMTYGTEGYSQGTISQFVSHST